MTYLLLILLALLPAGLLVYLVLWMDRNEREPMGLVLGTMTLGGAGFVPAAIIEVIGETIPFPAWGKLPLALWKSFVIIAPIEEICKIVPVFLWAWRHPQFNEENDGIVYTGASALGFATIENLFYVLSRGWGVGLARAVTSMPLHAFTGVVMGYYLGRAKFSLRGKKKLIVLGFLWAYLAHAVYDTLILSETLLALLVLPMIVVIAVLGWSVLKKGRAQSISQNVPLTIPSMEPIAMAGAESKKHGQIWKAIIGRTLIILSLLFWLILICGLTGERDPISIGMIIAGGLVISAVPLLVGIWLEAWYRRSNVS